MQKKQKIVEYRERLDKALASQDLVNEKSIRNLVKNQLIQSSPPNTHGFIDTFLENRTAEVSNFLDTLRSVPRDGSEVTKIGQMPQRDWKLKQDNDDFRVMYREGPEGTPFHTLLVEGYVNAPLDVYVFHGKQLFLKNGRVKVAWPLSARETILHYFVLEYYKDDLIIVLLKSISDPEGINISTHGFNGDVIPAAMDFVRIDCVGGFVLQKVTSNISYFRTIATMDIKLDYVPPSLINFLSRQLIGNGFKLYKKTVASIAKGDDEDFSKALKDPLYVRVREGLLPKNKFEKVPGSEALDSDKSARPSLNGHANKTPQIDTMFKEHLKPSLDGPAIKIPQIDTMLKEQISFDDSRRITSSLAGTPIPRQTYNFEIEEVALDEKTESEEKDRASHAKIEVEVAQDTISKEDELVDHSTRDSSAELCNKEKALISPEVEDALRVLDNAISMVRKGLSIPNWPGFGSDNQELHDSKRVAKEVHSTSSDDGGGLQVPEVDNLEGLDDDESSSGFFDIRYDKQDSPPQEMNQNQTSSPSPKPNTTILDAARDNTSFSSDNLNRVKAPVLDNMSRDSNEITIMANSTHKDADNDADHVMFKQKKQRRCCLYFFSAQK